MVAEIPGWSMMMLLSVSTDSQHFTVKLDAARLFPGSGYAASRFCFLHQQAGYFTGGLTWV
jgi:hypothetical protein